MAYTCELAGCFDNRLHCSHKFFNDGSRSRSAILCGGGHEAGNAGFHFRTVATRKTGKRWLEKGPSQVWAATKAHFYPMLARLRSRAADQPGASLDMQTLPCAREGSFARSSTRGWENPAASLGGAADILSRLFFLFLRTSSGTTASWALTSLARIYAECDCGPRGEGGGSTYDLSIAGETRGARVFLSVLSVCLSVRLWIDDQAKHQVDQRYIFSPATFVLSEVDFSSNKKQTKTKTPTDLAFKT